MRFHASAVKSVKPKKIQKREQVNACDSVGVLAAFWVLDRLDGPRVPTRYLSLFSTF